MWDNVLSPLLSVSPLYKHKHNKISLTLSWRISSIHVFCFALKAVHFDCESVCATEIMLWTKYLKWCVPMLLNYCTFIGVHFRQKSNLTSTFKPIYFWPWYKWWMIYYISKACVCIITMLHVLAGTCQSSALTVVLTACVYATLRQLVTLSPYKTDCSCHLCTAHSQVLNPKRLWWLMITPVHSD